MELMSLRTALEHFLASIHTDNELEPILEGFKNKDQVVLDELKVLVWAPFENEDLDRLSILITNQAEYNLSVLRKVKEFA
jgi:hypothetical protein